jgi:hypothetical protein
MGEQARDEDLECGKHAGLRGATQVVFSTAWENVIYISPAGI